MKKKVSTISRTRRAKSISPRGEHPYFCDAALGGIALRVIIADIRKHKPQENSTEKTPDEEPADKI